MIWPPASYNLNPRNGMSPKINKAARVICFLLAAIGFLNFGTFIALHDMFGGAADHVADGHYFLWSRYTISSQPRNCRLTEVSSFTYYWMLWQSQRLMLTHPLAIV